MLGVMPGQIGVQIGQVDALGDKGLVVAAVGVEQGHDEVHGVQIPQQHAVLPVSHSAFVGHDIHTFSLFLPKTVFLLYTRPAAGTSKKSRNRPVRGVSEKIGGLKRASGSAGRPLAVRYAPVSPLSRSHRAAEQSGGPA